MDHNAKEFHARMDQIPCAPLGLKGPDSKQYTQLPFKWSVTPELILKRFNMPDIPKYDETSDPQEHITTYITDMKGNDLAQHEIESVLLKNFGETLTKGALTWYSLLSEHPLDSFEMLANSFIKAHDGARKVQAQKADIFIVLQGESELLREFVILFQKERILLPVVPNEWEEKVFIKGLNPLSFDASRKLKESLLEFQSATWAVVHNSYESKTRIKDYQLGSSVSTKGRDRNKNQGRFKNDIDTDRQTSRSHFLSYERTDGRNNKMVFRHRIDLVLEMRNIKEARFQKPIRLDPSQRDPSLWCEYHGIHDHKTGDCWHLCEEVATLLKNDHLREFLSDRAMKNYGRSWGNAEPSKVVEGSPRMTINMIFGGNEVNGVTFSAAKKNEDIGDIQQETPGNSGR
ncbi:uncharacterized protein [Nicotiana tomentosiformis]|uniref:uncharacterized protein n=1 Tax=Nicotiana tomentosiformis TaxID=4098 RepID=UPI00388C36FC